MRLRTKASRETGSAAIFEKCLDLPQPPTQRWTFTPLDLANVESFLRIDDLASEKSIEPSLRGSTEKKIRSVSRS